MEQWRNITGALARNDYVVILIECAYYFYVLYIFLLNITNFKTTILSFSISTDLVTVRNLLFSGVFVTNEAE